MLVRWDKICLFINSTKFLYVNRHIMETAAGDRLKINVTNY